MLILFTIGVLLYTLGVSIAALFGNAKAKQWIGGRRAQMKQMKDLKSLRAQLRDKGHKTVDDGEWIWFHAASLGEFEQGRPVIEAIKRDYPQYKILLSFFSPSGYEVRKDYPLADEVLYLPSDTSYHAREWLDRHHFVAAFFIKYEFWFNYMRALKKRNIPLFYISLIFKPDSYFFKPYGRWFRKQLTAVSHFFVQDATTERLLRENGFNNVTLCGDTRFDRVAAIARQAKRFPEVERFIDGRQCIIAGSTWPPDESLLSAFISQMPDDYCFILAPHDVSETHIAKIKSMFPEASLYSELTSPCHYKGHEGIDSLRPSVHVIPTEERGSVSVDGRPRNDMPSTSETDLWASGSLSSHTEAQSVGSEVSCPCHTEAQSVGSEVSCPCHTEAQPRVSMGMKPSQILIINTIGILSQLYQYARFVYIGGGFGVGIHNIQEPVAFGCPVVFGPNHKGFKEAVDLVERKGAFCVSNADDLMRVFNALVNDEAAFSQASSTCLDYLNSQLGATEKVLNGFRKALFS